MGVGATRLSAYLPKHPALPKGKEGYARRVQGVRFFESVRLLGGGE